jgi:hypothetical protein
MGISPYTDAGRSTWVINVEAVDPVESCTLLALITFFRGFTFTRVLCTAAVTPVLLVLALTLVLALALALVLVVVVIVVVVLRIVVVWTVVIGTGRGSAGMNIGGKN